jgi:hypothetical protein
VVTVRQRAGSSREPGATVRRNLLRRFVVLAQAAPAARPAVAAKQRFDAPIGMQQRIAAGVPVLALQGIDAGTRHPRLAPHGAGHDRHQRLRHQLLQFGRASEAGLRVRVKNRQYFRRTQDAPALGRARIHPHHGRADIQRRGDRMRRAAYRRA